MSCNVSVPPVIPNALFYRKMVREHEYDQSILKCCGGLILVLVEDGLGDGNAAVFGNARVFDDAQVYGSAQISDNAAVYDYAQVFGNAEVCGDNWICDSAQVYGNAR